MDVYCPRCGEPWEHDSLHEEAQERYGIPYYVNDDARPWERKEKNPEYNSDDYQKIYREVSREFRSKGCSALTTAFGVSTCKPRDNTRTAATAVIYELLGDDMDGAAAMLDDAEYLGMFDE